MGFNIGYGYLHRIPAVSSNDVVFDSEVPMQTAFELAQQSQTPEAPPRVSIERKSGEHARPPYGRRRASHSMGHSGKMPSGIDDILREGQEKSEKEDFVPTAAVASGKEGALPPPPKRSSPVEHHAQ